MSDHDRRLSEAFDRQAPMFERAPVQSDPARLERLVRLSDLPPDTHLLDAGCGPGLVSVAFLRAGHRVTGVDLSAEMVARARDRCQPFAGRASFRRGSVYEDIPGAPFDAAVSRLVVHHVEDPAAFLRRLVEVVRPGGVVVVADHVTDPDPGRASWHNEIECLRDVTHTVNLTSGALVDELTRAGLDFLSLTEEAFTLDFDEWFDRGTPAAPKAEVRARILAGPGARGFRALPGRGPSLAIDGRAAIVRGVKPLEP